jgi:hypothetical protein
MDKAQKLEILNALVARAAVNNKHLDHLNMLYHTMISHDPMTDQKDDTEAKKLVAEEKRLAALGETYFAEGYRVRYTERFTVGIPYWHRVPDEAILFRRVPAGYLATCEQQRIEYLIKRS